MRAISWAVTLVAAVLLIPFALSNREPVSLGFWPLPFLIDLPLYLLPGNHDARGPMAEAFADHAYLPRNGEFLHCDNAVSSRRR